jgi:hypothetical protein
LEAEVDVRWNAANGDNLNREATFNQLPIEEARIESLDSVFARPFSKRYNDIMLSRLGTGSRTHSDNFSANADVETRIKTPNMMGRVGVDVSGSYNFSKDKSRTLYAQHFGGANPDAAAVPVNSDRFSANGSQGYNFSVSTDYRRSWTEIVDEKWQSSWNFNGSVAFSRSYSANDANLFIAENQTENALPSLTQPEQAIQDLNDSYNSNQGNNDVNVRGNLTYSYQPIAPTDYGINPSFKFQLGLNYAMNNKRLEYNTLSPTHEVLTRTKHHVTPNAMFNFSSINEARNVNFRLNYNFNESDPALNLFLNHRNNADPMHIYLNNADGLKTARTHNAGFGVSRYGRKRHDNFYLSGNWNMTTNAIGRANEYDPNTGITTSRPMNIQGNWGVTASTGYSIPFGKREQFRVGLNINGGYNHSVDFQSTKGPAMRSLVRNTTAGAQLSLNYQLENGSTFWLTATPNWTNAQSERANFQTINAMTYGAHAGTSLILPWQLRFYTNINMNMRRGYQDASMNDTQWLWNATLSKQLLKGAMTIKLAVTDILGQIDPVYITVNAQGRTETWTNTMPRYGMLTIQWNFNHHPAKGMPKAAPKSLREYGGFPGGNGGGGGRGRSRR